MSTPIGHAIAALAIYKARRPIPRRKNQLLWPGLLLLIALAPDLDYVVPNLNLFHQNGQRITHSLLFSLLLPSLTVLCLSLARVGGELLPMSLQAIASGLSHLLLDLLVGAQGLPLLFPVSRRTFQLPFGILPSAGWFWIDNPLFYRNLIIEIGVMVPLWFGLSLLFNKKPHTAVTVAAGLWLCLISTGFMAWAYRLSR